MTAQHSTFTFHGKIGTPLESMSELKQLLDHGHLGRILVEAGDDDSIEDLRDELSILGMRNSTVFPDLGGVARDICEDYAPAPE